MTEAAMPVYVGPKGPAPRFPDLTQVARARGSLVTALGAAIEVTAGDEDCAQRAILIVELHKACGALGMRMTPEPEDAARLQRRTGAILAVIVALLVFVAGAMGFVAGDLNCRIDAAPAPAPSATLKRLA